MNDLTNLQKLFQDKLFRIPDYQRGYSWGEQQLEEFWDDLISLLPGQHHYTGMISLKKVKNSTINNNPDRWINEQWLINAGYEIFEIVDGQQRLTTLIILINETLEYCRKNNISELNDMSIDKISEKFIRETKNEGIIRTYKFGYEVDNPSYTYFKKVILNDPDATKAEETFYTLNLSNAKDFFRKKLEGSDIKEVEGIFRKVTLYLEFNLYFIEDDFNVFVAFETMNNRGKRLSYLELLKNRLIYLSTLFKNDEDEKETVRNDINDTWKEIYGYLGKDKHRPLSDDEFLQHHWMIYFGYNTRKISGNKTIQFYTYLLNKYFIQQNIETNGLRSIDSSEEPVTEDDFAVDQVSDEEYGFDDESDNDTTESNIKLTGNGELRLTDIKRYINSLKELIPHWYTTFNPSTVTNPEIAKYLFRLNTLGYINSRPLVTVILSKSTISDADRIECLKLIERFNFLHYRLNGYFATYSNSTFYNLARDLYYNKIGLDEVLEVISRIDFLSDNNVVTSHGIIDKFEKLSKRDGFYSWGSLKFLLYIYDLSLTKTDSEKKINPDEYFKQEPKDHCSIEHIYPQKGTDKYWSDRFDKYSPNERKRLNGSLGNMLALSARINSKLQNRSFDSKIQERYNSGSKSELMVAAWPSKEWTPESILGRGMEILHFIEKEFDFVFPNDKYRKEVLGLGFMVNEGDEDSNKTVAITESADEKITSQEFKAEDFEKLSSGANKELLDIFETINDYCLSISQNIIRNTTKHYIGYSEGKSFADFHFNSGYCHLMLRTIKYSDPQGKIELLGDNYNWVKKAKLRIYPGDDLEYIKGLIKQSYDSLFNN